MPERIFSPLPPATGQTVTEQIFEAIYAAIISFDLPPGTRISEAEIAKRMDVSRQPVRDAFFRLSNLGFLLVRPQRPTLVTRISERAVKRAVFVRCAVEVECIRLFLTEDRPADLTGIRAVLEAQRVADTTSDKLTFLKLDDAFHDELCRLAGHDDIWASIRDHKAHLDRMRYLALTNPGQAEIWAEHLSLFEAIEARNGSLAEELLRAHIGRSVKNLVVQRTLNPDYFEEETV